MKNMKLKFVTVLACVVSYLGFSAAVITESQLKHFLSQGVSCGFFEATVVVDARNKKILERTIVPTPDLFQTYSRECAGLREMTEDLSSEFKIFFRSQINKREAIAAAVQNTLGLPNKIDTRKDIVVACESQGPRHARGAKYINYFEFAYLVDPKKENAEIKARKEEREVVSAAKLAKALITPPEEDQRNLDDLVAAIGEPTGESSKKAPKAKSKIKSEAVKLEEERAKAAARESEMSERVDPASSGSVPAAGASSSSGARTADMSSSSGGPIASESSTVNPSPADAGRAQNPPRKSGKKKK